MAYDLLITNARIVDGTGAPAIDGSIGISDGRIAAVGEAAGLAKATIDAQGQAVAPGFIDLHTHYDAQVTWDPLCTPSCYHGTTTVVMGNCGYAMAPARPEDRDYLMGMFSSVEGVSKQTLVNGIPWEWETAADYNSWLRHRGLGVNIAAQVGHSAVRRYVMGPEAHEREATAEEIESMTGLVRRGLETGAVGFTTSRVAHQKGEHGEPIPSYVASEEELFTLAGVLREMNAGIIGINPRTKALDFNQEDRDQLVRLANETGRVVTWNEFNHRWQYPGQWRSLLDFMEAAQLGGAQVYAVMRCQRGDSLFNLREGYYAFDPSSAWKDLMSLPHEQKLLQLGDAERRIELAEQVAPALKGGWVPIERLGVAKAALEKNRDMDGRLFADIGRERGEDPMRVFVDLAAEERLETGFGFLGVTNGDDDAVEAMLKSPATITGISDAGAHLHSGCGADYPTYFLNKWVKERSAFSLEHAVWSLTGQPAQLAGLTGRGILAPGAAADLCIFDPDSIAPLPLEVWHDLPGGESRHVKRAQGVECVIVNGQVLMERGEPTGALPGRLLSGQASNASMSLRG
jgi:N-acyl-D-amino-acid deacylase